MTPSDMTPSDMVVWLSGKLPLDSPSVLASSETGATHVVATTSAPRNLVRCVVDIVETLELPGEVPSATEPQAANRVVGIETTPERIAHERRIVFEIRRANRSGTTKLAPLKT
jgi:hypothetical protein